MTQDLPAQENKIVRQILQTIERANNFLDEATELEQVVQVKSVADMAEAAARAIKSGESLEKARKLKINCERKAGEFLKGTPKNPGTRTGGAGGSILPPPDHIPKLSDLGISKTESSRWQKLAAIPDEKFEEYISKTKKATESAVRRLADEVIASEIGKPVGDLTKLGRFDVILCDAPWTYDLLMRGSPDKHYPTMTLDEICKIQVPAKDNAILFLWATNPLLQEALEVMAAWGFTYKTNLVWVKDKIGTGHYFRGQHELLLLGTKGKTRTPPEDSRPSSVLMADRTKHSEKPEGVYEIIERMYPKQSYIEMFARNRRSNWMSWGNEIATP